MNSKIVFALSLIPILLVSNISIAAAKNVALAVMNVNSLDPINEQPLYNILTSMNESVTLVDQNSNVNWNKFDLIVVAGRPPASSPLPQSFALSIPVNSVPTIAIDFYYPYSWGWINSGPDDLISSGPISVFVALNHPITSGYSLNQRIFVQNQSQLDAVDFIAGTSNFTNVANLDQRGDGGIAFASPNTILTNGQISNNSAAIFFGILYPAYWTSDTVNLFENSVDWITNIHFVPPTATVLSGPSTSVSSSATYSWTASSGPNGIEGYEIQIATSPDFKQIIVDTQTSSLSYTLAGMLDGQSYFVRARAIDFLNLMSPWSNTISTVADFAPIILTISSPSSGSDLPIGQSVAVNVSVSSPRLQGSVCAFYIDQNLVGTLTINLSSMTCSGTLTIPQLSSGPTSTNFNVSVTDFYGGTNSTTVPITVSNRVASQTTTTTSATSTQTSSVTTGSSGTSSSGGSYSIFDLTTPDSVTDFPNTDHTFTIIGRNDGNTDIHATKLTLVPEGNSFTVTINPQGTFDLSSGQSTTYTVTVHTPSSTGDYYLDVRSLSYETSESVRRIPVHVIAQPMTLEYGITNIEIPDFTNGITSLLNITILNKGNIVGTASVNITLPDGWSATAYSENADIIPNQAATFLFEVTPILSSGNITFSGTFSGNGTTKEFNYPVQVSAKENPNNLSAITASITATLENPMVAIPTVIAAGAAIALYYKFTTDKNFGSKYVWSRTKASYGKIVPKTHQKNNFAKIKTNPSAQAPRANNAYDKWEKGFRRS